MRHISTLFFCLVLLFSTANAQDSSNLKILGLKILNRQLPPSTPTSEPVTIRLRCGGSSLNNEPLIIVDGIVAEKSKLNNINPDNIESISILKDQMATALYGYRAAQGVIIITTKSANQRTVQIKDFMSGEVLPAASIDLIYGENKRDNLHLVADSLGRIITNKIVYGKEYELRVSCIGYKTFSRYVNTRIIGNNYTVALQRNYSELNCIVVIGYPAIRCGTYCGSISYLRAYETKNSYIKNDSSKKEIKIYPNPLLRFQKVNIQFKNKEDAKLTVRLLYLDGKLIGSTEYQMKKGINTISYSPNGSLATGMYVLQIIDENNRLLKTDKLIIQ